MKGKSAKNKGYRLEKLVAKHIRDSGVDPRAGREIGSGSGANKGDIRDSTPFTIEVKNQKSYNINGWVDQAKDQARLGNTDPDKWALVFRDYRTPESNPDLYALIDFHSWLELLKGLKSEFFEEISDKDLAYKGRRARAAINEFVKHLEKYGD